jgi:hypothetical protein
VKDLAARVRFSHPKQVESRDVSSREEHHFHTVRVRSFHSCNERRAAGQFLGAADAFFLKHPHQLDLVSLGNLARLLQADGTAGFFRFTEAYAKRSRK